MIGVNKSRTPETTNTMIWKYERENSMISVRDSGDLCKPLSSEKERCMIKWNLVFKLWMLKPYYINLRFGGDCRQVRYFGVHIFITFAVDFWTLTVLDLPYLGGLGIAKYDM